MAITSLAAYRAALKQTIYYRKNFNGSATGQGEAQSWVQRLWESTGDPGAGSITPSNATNGVVLTNSTTGAMPLPSWTGSAYITRVAYSSTVSGSPIAIVLHDFLWIGGQHGAANYPYTAQPSFASRVPGGTDFSGLQIWVEKSAGAPTGANITITYTDQSGNTGHTTPTTTINTGGTNNAGYYRIPLQSGDCGVQKIENVLNTGPDPLNVFIIRPLVWLPATVAERQQVQWLDQTGMPQIYPTSCLSCLYYGESFTVLQGVALDIEIASA